VAPNQLVNGYSKKAYGSPVQLCLTSFFQVDLGIFSFSHWCLVFLGNDASDVGPAVMDFYCFFFSFYLVSQ
jgi:hypothetical protein